MKSLLIKTILVVSAVALTGILAWANAESAAGYNAEEIAAQKSTKPKQTTEAGECPECEKRAFQGRLGDRTNAPSSATPSGSGASSGGGTDGER
ncbi:MAG: hypothetical protein KF865_09500 [Bdellovibrionaceae bacterium]|nr:hypothetical protein [Pseudobdellovibrionaceae bacterium]